MRKALIVGLNFYSNVKTLRGCVNDAYAIDQVLSRHGDGTKNFDTKLICAVDENSSVTRQSLKELLRELFSGDSDIGLFYFSGHGYIESTGGYIITSECNSGDDGLSMSDILQIVNDSNVKNKIIFLDCCHAGQMGNFQSSSTTSLANGVTILTASTHEQYALENHGSGVFTSLVIDALNGAAANLLGDITPGSVYAHIDQSLGAWDQRPVFKTNVKEFISLRRVPSFISRVDLMKIPELFPDKNEHALDPSYEPDSENPNQLNNEKFAILQKLNRVNLVVPINAEHMYFAAMEHKSCKLTILGEHYWNLVTNDRI